MSEGLKLLPILCLFGVLLAFVANILYWRVLRQSVMKAPRLSLTQSDWEIADSITTTVIIPVYNEAAQIEDCVRSMLQSSTWTSDRLQVWVVDDQSTDGTLEQLSSLKERLADPRLVVIAGQPRPTNMLWVGKNWACQQAAQQVSSDYLLFLDADVRLNPGAIERAITHVHAHQLDLMTGVLAIDCECWAEWLVQPLIVGVVTAGLPFSEVNDPKSDVVFAAGPFMLFRRVAYKRIGGHRAVCDQVVEDVELARRIQQKGLNLHYVIITDLGTLRMYPSTAALWEGWTKNWHLASHRHLPTSLYGALMVFLLCVVPLLGLVGFSVASAIAPFNLINGLGLAIALFTLSLPYLLRREIQTVAAIPPRYWYLTGIGGIFFLAIIFASIIKTETGWGWTWRGRALQLPAGKSENEEF